MSSDSKDSLWERLPGQRPPIEFLAAFLDGELSADDRQFVQNWLAAHPEEAEVVQTHRNLLRFWREAAPPEPAEKAWREVLAQIESCGTPGMGVQRTHGADVVRSSSLDSRFSAPTRSRWIRVGLLALAAAAAVLLAVFGSRKELPPPADPLGPELTLLAPDDVDLVSMEMTDTQLLVVGNLPVQEPMELVAPGDVTFHKVAPDVAPMIVAPSGVPRTKDPGGK
jgi:hypothetical protein